MRYFERSGGGAGSAPGRGRWAGLLGRGGSGGWWLGDDFRQGATGPSRTTRAPGIEQSQVVTMSLCYPVGWGEERQR
jgi:hypothetical protein